MLSPPWPRHAPVPLPRIGRALLVASGFAALYGGTRAWAHHIFPFERFYEGFEVVPPVPAMAGIALVAFTVTWGWLALEAVTRMDPERLAAANLSWSIRRLAQPSSIVVAALFHASLATSFWALDRLWPALGDGLGIFYASFVLPALWCALVPLCLAQPAVAEKPPSSTRWRFPRPRVPSSAELSALFQLTCASCGLLILGWWIDAAAFAPLTLMGGRHGFETTLDGAIARFLVFPGVTAIAATLVFRLRPRTAFRRWMSYYRWRALGPLLAFQARLYLGLLILDGLRLAHWFLSEKIFPILAAWNHHHDIATSSWVRHTAQALEFVDSWLSLTALPFLWLFLWFSAGRLAWQLDRLRAAHGSKLKSSRYTP